VKVVLNWIACARLVAVKRVAVALLAILLSGASVRAEDYPNRPIKIVCIHPVGITTDLLARALASKISETLGQPVVVENRPGANGIIAAGVVAKSPPDGYTMLMTSSAHVGNAHVRKDLTFDTLNDFSPITMLGGSYGLVLVTALPVKSLAELIELGKKKTLTYSTNGAGNTTHIAGLLLEKRTGLMMTAIPYNTNNMITDVISGNVDFMFFGTVNAEPLIKAGQLRALAVSGEQRSRILPDVPTMQELGYKDFNVSGYFGLLFPANTPRDRVERIQSETAKALAAPELKRIMEASDYFISGSKPDEFSAFLRRDYEFQDRLMREVGLKAN
jgi:tripartite-type tricarboxylate transporter receptor subunit TctC